MAIQKPPKRAKQEITAATTCHIAAYHNKATFMEYNFDAPPDRHGTNSYKWDSSDDRAMLPLWVADMDFTTCPAVIEALRKRIEHGIYGYTHVGNDYYNVSSAGSHAGMLLTSEKSGSYTHQVLCRPYQP